MCTGIRSCPRHGGAGAIAVKTSAQAHVRGGNRRDVLQLIIHGHGTATRAGIARATGLTSATISSIVAELVDLELVEHAGLADSTGGKPATSLRIRTSGRGLGVLIVRKRWIRSAIVNLEGDVILELPRFSTEGVVSTRNVRDAVVKLAARTPLPLLAIAVDLPGALSDGVVVESIQLNFHDEHLAANLTEIAPCPVYLINDAKADALREYSLDPPDDQTLFSLSLGSGVGGAMILNGMLHTGPRSLAGELGHVRVDFSDDALLCPCGNRGCLERLASIPGLLGLDSHTAVDTDEPSALVLPSSPEDRRRTSRTAQILAQALITVCATVDVSTVVINGAAARLGPAFLAELQERCDALHPVGIHRLVLRYATGGVTLPFRGGADHALRQALDVRWSR